MILKNQNQIHLERGINNVSSNYLILLTIIIQTLTVFFVYRQGLKDGKAVKEEKKLEPVIPELKLYKKQEVNKEIKKLNDILDNIDNYNGSPQGQKVVK